MEIFSLSISKWKKSVGTKLANSDSFGRNRHLVPINRVKKEIKIRKYSLSSPSLKRLQFPLSLSCVTSLDGLYITGNFDKKFVNSDKRATNEYDRMRENSKLESVESFKYPSDGSLLISLLNVRSLAKHAIDIKHDNFLIQNDILCLTETQLTDEPDCSICDLLSPLSISVNNTGPDKYSSIALVHRGNVVIKNHYLIPGAQTSLNIILLYRKNNLRQADFLYNIQHLRSRVDKVHIILGDFNINALAHPEINFLNEYLSHDYQMVVSSPTHISGSLIDHVYVHKDLLEDGKIDFILHNVYFSDHDAIMLRLKIREREKNEHID